MYASQRLQTLFAYNYWARDKILTATCDRTARGCVAQPSVSDRRIWSLQKRVEESSVSRLLRQPGKPRRPSTWSHITTRFAFRRSTSCIRSHTHPDPEPESWHIDRQVERFQAALQASGDLVILDGDPYQPVWFNWIFPESGFPSWWRCIEIFTARSQRLVVPDFYVYLHTQSDERFRRMVFRYAKLGLDRERAIVKYERDAGLEEARRDFFRALDKAFPGLVLFVEAIDLERTFEAFRDYRNTPPSVVDLLNAMSSWLAENDIGTYRPGVFMDSPPR